MSTQTLRGLQNLIRISHSDRPYQEVGKVLLCNRSALVRTGPGDKQLIVSPDVLRAVHVRLQSYPRVTHEELLIWRTRQPQMNITNTLS